MHILTYFSRYNTGILVYFKMYILRYSWNTCITSGEISDFCHKRDIITLSNTIKDVRVFWTYFIDYARIDENIVDEQQNYILLGHKYHI